MFAIQNLTIIEDEFLEATISSSEAADSLILQAEILPAQLPLAVQQVCWSSTGACAVSIFTEHEKEIRDLLSAAF